MHTRALSVSASVASLVSAAWIVSPRAAIAHIRLTSPTARFTQNDNGLKTAPCGSGTATNAVTQLTPGQSLSVAWKESVGHSGHFRIALAENESDFVEPKDLNIPTTPPSWVLADGIADKTGTQTYTQTVQLPNRECASCVLQLIQVMGTGTDGTNNGPFSGVYHACADLRIVGGSADAGPPGEDGGRPDGAAPDLAPGRPEAGGDRQARDLVGAGTGGAGGSGEGGQSGSSGAGGSGSGGIAASGGQTGSGGGGGEATGGRGGAGGSASSGGALGSGGNASGGGSGGKPGSGGSVAAGGASGGAGGASAGGTSGGQAPGDSGGCNVAPGAGSAWLTLAFGAWLALAATRRRRGRPTDPTRSRR